MRCIYYLFKEELCCVRIVRVDDFGKEMNIVVGVEYYYRVEIFVKLRLFNFIEEDNLFIYLYFEFLIF